MIFDITVCHIVKASSGLFVETNVTINMHIIKGRPYCMKHSQQIASELHQVQPESGV